MSTVSMLRAATQAAHHQLDHHPLLRGLVRPGLDLPHYAQALAALHAPQAALEALLTSTARPEEIAQETLFAARTPDLEADLADLAHLGQAPWPLAATPPPASHPAARLGIRYVLEGACLGAAFIGRGLAARLSEAPRRYFCTPNPARWVHFQQLLASTCADDFPSLIASAQASFACYHQHLNACLTLSGCPDGDLDDRQPEPGSPHYGPAGDGR